jgi:hypothetical protein
MKADRLRPGCACPTQTGAGGTDGSPATPGPGRWGIALGGEKWRRRSARSRHGSIGLGERAMRGIASARCAGRIRACEVCRLTKHVGCTPYPRAGPGHLLPAVPRAGPNPTASPPWGQPPTYAPGDRGRFLLGPPMTAPGFDQARGHVDYLWRGGPRHPGSLDRHHSGRSPRHPRDGGGGPDVLAADHAPPKLASDVFRAVVEVGGLGLLRTMQAAAQAVFSSRQALAGCCRSETGPLSSPSRRSFVVLADSARRLGSSSAQRHKNVQGWLLFHHSSN